MWGDFMSAGRSGCEGNDNDNRRDIKVSFPIDQGFRASFDEILCQSRREHAVLLLEGIEALRHLIRQIESDPESAKLFRGSLQALGSHLELLSKAFDEVLLTLNESHPKITD